MSEPCVQAGERAQGPLPGATEQGAARPAPSPSEEAGGLPAHRLLLPPSQSRPAVRPQPPLTPEALGQDTRAQLPGRRLGVRARMPGARDVKKGGLPPPSATGSAGTSQGSAGGRGFPGQRWGKGARCQEVQKPPPSTPRGRDTTADKWPKSYWVEKDG